MQIPLRRDLGAAREGPRDTRRVSVEGGEQHPRITLSFFMYCETSPGGGVATAISPTLLRTALEPAGNRHSRFLLTDAIGDPFSGDWQSEEICSANTPDLLAAVQDALEQLRRGGPRWTIEESLANALARAKAQGSMS